MVVKNLFKKYFWSNTLGVGNLSRRDGIDIDDSGTFAFPTTPEILCVEYVLSRLCVFNFNKVVSKSLGRLALDIFVGAGGLIPLTQGCKVTGVTLLRSTSLGGLSHCNSNKVFIVASDLESKQFRSHVLKLCSYEVIVSIVIEFADVD